MSTNQEVKLNMQAIRRLQFCCGHRVKGHEGKCANPHGHNYVLYIHAKPNQELDAIGRVIDFSVLKEKIGNWIDVNWDHTFVLCESDQALALALNEFHKKPIYMMEKNPTAENMALLLKEKICPYLLAGEDITVEKIVLWETENCYVEV